MHEINLNKILCLWASAIGGIHLRNKKLGALFIDFDNIYVSLIEQYRYSQSEAQAKVIDIINNTIVHIDEKLEVSPIIRSSFADWSMYPDIPNELYTMGVKISHVKAVRGKNSADIDLSLTLLEIMLTRPDIDVLVIVAGDRDYLPVARRVHEIGKDILFYSFKRALSGDIKKLVGKERYWYIDPHKNAITPKSGKTSVPESRKKGKVKKGGKTYGQLTKNQGRALSAAIEAEKEYGPKYGNVKLSGFIRDMMEKTLPQKSHIERKEIFNTLVEVGAIDLNTEYYPWGAPFYVFTTNKDHEAVKRELKNIEKK